MKYRIKYLNSDCYCIIDEYNQLITTLYGMSSLVIATAACDTLNGKANEFFSGWTKRSQEYMLE